MNFSSYSKYSTSINGGSAIGSDPLISLPNNNLSNTMPLNTSPWLAQPQANNNQYKSLNGNHGNNQFNIMNGNYNGNRNRYAPYQNRSYSVGNILAPSNHQNQQYHQHYPSVQPILNQSYCPNTGKPYYQYVSSNMPYNNCNKILTESSNISKHINNNCNAKKMNPLMSFGSCHNLLQRSSQSYNQNISNMNKNVTNNVITSSSSSTLSSNSITQAQSNNLIGSSEMNNSIGNNGTLNGNGDPNSPVSLQINNLDYSLEEQQLRGFLLNQLKPITPVISLIFEGSTCAKVTVPDLYYAKQVVSNLHRKKIGYKRVVVSYTRDSSLTDITTLRCQVAGLLKEVPYWTLPMNKFRELFQSRFKTSISVLDLYKMQDICAIKTDENEDKHISLNPELISSIENNPLIEGLHESVPYCSLHFRKEQHKGWAEQEIEPLPNVFMTISEMRQIICPLLKSHEGDIPVSTVTYCIAGELGLQINRNENGVNLEHLICCINGIQITNNNFGIKVIGWLEPENVIGKDSNNDRFIKSGSPGDPLYQISKEVIELVKMSPKSTMKFNRFIPAYHNHFGKQCRVADYGYTKLIELFEALSSVIQIMGDGENRQITLTHKTQIRRFTTDLLRILKSQGNKSILLSQLPEIYAQTQSRMFDVTDYGVCAIEDILDGLANSNIIVMQPIQNGNDILISIPKRKQTIVEVEKTCVFAAEVVELLSNAPQYSILFQKFVRSYHYHFGYQCRLSDYGFLKLADLMEAIQGVVEIELTNDEDKKIFLSPKIARRVFAEQIEELTRVNTGASNTCMKLDEVLLLHKKKYGYQIQSQTLGFANIFDAIRELPFIEIIENESQLYIICHLNDQNFRNQTLKVCRIILDSEPNLITLEELMNTYSVNNNGEVLKQTTIIAMKHAIDFKIENNNNHVILTRLMKYIMKVFKLVDQYKSITLGEIKKNLSIVLGDCFEIGYPNIYTLIQAFPDIFNFEINSLINQSKVAIVSSCVLLPNLSNSGSVKCQTKTKVPKQLEKQQSFGNNTFQQLNSFNDGIDFSNGNILKQNFISNNDFYNGYINDNFMSNYLENDKENHGGDINENIQKYCMGNMNNPLKCPPGFIMHNNLAGFQNGFTQNLIQLQQLQNQQDHQNLLTQYYGKSDTSFNGSFNSSSNDASIDMNLNYPNPNSLSLSNGSANSVISSSDSGMNSSDGLSSNVNNNDQFADFPSKLWVDGADYFNNNLNYSESEDIFGLFKNSNIKSSTNSDHQCLNNPKGKIENSDILPYLVDPIWGNDNKKTEFSPDQKNSTLKCPAKFEMSELQSYNVILPTLLSPKNELSENVQTSKTQNMNLFMFQNDNSDDKLSS